MLFDVSEDGDSDRGTAGLGLLPGKVVRFRLDGQLQQDGSRFKVPQMGWNQVKQSVSHPLWHGIADDSYFFFVHSYYAVPENPAHTVGQRLYRAPCYCELGRDNMLASNFRT